MIFEVSQPKIFIEKIPAAASMINVLVPHSLSEEMKSSSKKNKGSVPNDSSISADRIEEYKGIRMSMPLVEEESEPVDEESEPNEEDSQ